MKIGVLPVGHISPEVQHDLAGALIKIFPDTSCFAIGEALPIPAGAYVDKRGQYNSAVILSAVRVFAESNAGFDRVLGVVDVDLFASGLNFVFGEAFSPGRAALISLWRLRPSFYGEPNDDGVFFLRTLKEAVHELGHTLGVRHCPKESCVMHFSNSISDTDGKESLFCQQDYLQASLAIKHFRETP